MENLKLIWSPAIHIYPEQIRAARAMLEWSQEDLSKRIGVSRRALAIYESGGSTLKEENILQLKDIFQKAGVTFTNGDHGALGICMSEEAVMEGRLRKRELRR